MSSQTSPSLFTLRRSTEIGRSQTVLFVTGLWLVIVLIGLLGPVSEFASTNTTWVFLLSGLFLLPSILNHIELRSRAQITTFNSYHLIKLMERSWLTYFAGWFYLLGWIVISAMLAELTGDLLNRFLAEGFMFGTVFGPVRIVGALIVLSTVVGLFGYTIPMRFSARLLLVVTLIMIAFGGFMAVTAILGGIQLPLETTTDPDAENRFFRAVLIAVAAAWSIGAFGREQPRVHRDAGSQFGQLFWPIMLSALFAAIVAVYDPTRFSIIELAGTVSPMYGRLVAEGISIIAVLISWQVISLVMLRQFQTIAVDGVVPTFLVKSQGGLPHWLLLMHGLLTLVAVRIGWIEILSQLAALVFLLLESVVCIAAIAIIRRDGPAKKGQFSLPFFPMFPVMGVALNVLLSLAATSWLLLIMIGWGAIGAVLYFQGARRRMRLHEVGVTVFQDVSNNPNLYSDFAVIVPMKNDADDQGLLRLGATLARENEGHVSVLQVVEVPEQMPLELMAQKAEQGLQELQPQIGFVEGLGAPAEGIARLSHSVAQSILDTSNEEQAKIIIMGWAKEGEEERMRRGLLEEILDGTTADVLLLNKPTPVRIKDVLVPITGGPHSLRSVELGMAITRHTKGSVTLLSVVEDDENRYGVLQAERRLDALIDRLHEQLHEQREGLLQNVKQTMQTRRISTKVIASSEPPELVIARESERYDLVMMGATELGFLEQEAISNFARNVAARTETPIVLTRAVTSFGAVLARRVFYSISNLLPTLTSLEREELFNNLREAGRPSINFFVLIALSSAIATLGLISNNPATVLGAMLVAPLMSSIVSVAGSITFSNTQLLRSAITATLQGCVSAVFVAVIISLLVPGDIITDTVLSFVRPTLFDLLVALLSGVAGSYAIARREVGQALPGVALALAFVPPLGTIGVGIAERLPDVFLGGLVTFLTNAVAIIFAACITFLLLGVRPARRQEDQRQLYRNLLLAIIALIVLMMPLVLVLNQTIRRNQYEARAEELIREAIQDWDARSRLATYEAEFENITPIRQEMLITGTVYIPESLDDYSITDLETQLQVELRPDVTLELFVLPGIIIQSDVKAPPN